MRGRFRGSVQAINSLLVWPAGSEISPEVPGRTAVIEPRMPIRRSTESTKSSSALPTGVTEERPLALSSQRSLPVAGSNDWVLAPPEAISSRGACSSRGRACSSWIFPGERPARSPRRLWRRGRRGRMTCRCRTGGRRGRRGGRASCRCPSPSAWGRRRGPCSRGACRRDHSNIDPYFRNRQ